MMLNDKYDKAVECAIDEWLNGGYGGFAVRRELIEPEMVSWLYSAAKIGANLVIEDKVEGLLADLDAAIEVAWKRGAHDWVRLNYPKHYEGFTCGR